MEGELDFDNVHDQIQPYLFEPQASGHDSSDNNSRELDLASKDGDYDVNQERIGQVDLQAFEINRRPALKKSS